MSEIDDNTNAKPEHMRKAVKLDRTVDETIAKLKAAGFQYATAGDARRLIEEIERLRGWADFNGLRTDEPPPTRAEALDLAQWARDVGLTANEERED